jgi:hypothetical protein
MIFSWTKLRNFTIGIFLFPSIPKISLGQVGLVLPAMPWGIVSN